MSVLSKISRIVGDSNYRFLVLDEMGLFNSMSTPKYLKRKYKAMTGQTLNLELPKTYNEKLQWLKIYDHNPKYISMVDKYEAKEIIKETVGEAYVIPTLGVWDDANDIDFSILPKQFVIKCTHASGANIICKDKDSLDIDATRKKLNAWLKKDWYYYGREWPYLNCKHRIIAEEYMIDSADMNSTEQAATDYKYFCFNGEPKVMYISKDKAADPRTDFFDMDFNHLPITMKDRNADIAPEKPEQFEQMRLIASKLSNGIPHLRVDFYIFNNRIYVGEMTFYHCSGFSLMHRDNWNQTMGEWIDISRIQKT